MGRSSSPTYCFMGILCASAPLRLRIYVYWCHPWRSPGGAGVQIGSPADLSNPGGLVHTALSAK